MRKTGEAKRVKATFGAFVDMLDDDLGIDLREVERACKEVKVGEVRRIKTLVITRPTGNTVRIASVRQDKGYAVLTSRR